MANIKCAASLPSFRAVLPRTTSKYTCRTGLHINLNYLVTCTKIYFNIAQNNLIQGTKVPKLENKVLKLCLYEGHVFGTSRQAALWENPAPHRMCLNGAASNRSVGR